MRIEIYNDDNTLRGVLGIEPECKVDDFADELRLLCQIAGYTAKQARDILPTSEDWDRFIGEMKTLFSTDEGCKKAWEQVEVDGATMTLKSCPQCNQAPELQNGSC